MAKLDFEIAFNTVLRTWLLEVAATKVPSLFPLISLAYASPSHLFFGEFLISSEVGLQQGDPLAPALFCLAFHPMLESLVAKLNANYLDDVTLGDKGDVILEDIKRIIQQLAEV